jgi:hypothetical protein
MRQKYVFLNFVGLIFLASFSSKPSLACGGMTFPGSFLCGNTSGAAYTSGYPSLTASLVYVPTSLLGGYSQPISYPPNPLAPKSTTTTTASPYSYSYPSAYSYPSYGYGYGYPSYGLSSGGLGGCGTSALFPSYGSAGGLLTGGLGSCGGGGLYAGLTGLTGLGGCGSGTSLFPSYGYGYPSSGYGYPSTGYSYGYPSSGYGYPSSGYASYPVITAPVVTVLAPATHGCSTNGASGGIPVYSAPRPVCSQFCGVARNLMRPISRGHSLISNRLY